MLNTKLNFTNIKRNVSAAVKLLGSSGQSKKLLYQLAPDIVVGTGGYVSGPFLRKAAQMGIKTAIHEQNAFPGVTTKMLAPRVDVVMLAMPEAWSRIAPQSAFRERFPNDYSYTENGCVITGNPVRESVIYMKKSDARKTLGLDERPMILSFGGSLGAKRLNETVAELLAAHAASGKYYHYHAIGKYGMDWMPALLHQNGVDYETLPYLRVTEYINDMELCMAAADLVICRAGAITLSELQVQGKASILIPSPNVAENHQYHNAMTLQKSGAAVVIEEKELTGERLTSEALRLMGQPELLREMGQNAQKSAIYDANERIYSVIMKLCSQGK